MTKIKTGETTSRSHSFEALGTRKIQWLADAKGVDETTTFSRKKEITSEVVRTVSFQNKSGEERELKLTVAIESADPLLVNVVRNLSTKVLVSKTIESGTVIATNTDESRLESDFQNVLVTFADSECVVASGVIVASFFKAGTTDAQKVLTATFANGTATLTDKDGNQIGDSFTVDGCGDGEDFSGR